MCSWAHESVQENITDDHALIAISSDIESDGADKGMPVLGLTCQCVHLVTYMGLHYFY